MNVSNIKCCEFLLLTNVSGDVVIILNIYHNLQTLTLYTQDTGGGEGAFKQASPPPSSWPPPQSALQTSQTSSVVSAGLLLNEKR